MENINNKKRLVLLFVLLQIVYYVITSFVFIPELSGLQYYLLIINWFLSLFLANRLLRFSENNTAFFRFFIYFITCAILLIFTYCVTNRRLFDICINDVYPIENSSIRFFKGSWRKGNQLGESIFVQNSMLPILEEVEIIPHIWGDKLQFQQIDDIIIFKEGEWQLAYDVDKNTVVK